MYTYRYMNYYKEREGNKLWKNRDRIKNGLYVKKKHRNQFHQAYEINPECQV